MTDTKRAERRRLVRALGGERNAARVEQLRAAGLPAAAVAVRVGGTVATIEGWYRWQDGLVLEHDVDGAA